MANERNLFLQNLAQTSPAPLLLDIISASGSFIQTRDGRKILDFISGISVSGLGHRHPSIIKAIKDQCDHYLHVMVYGEVIQSPQVMLASKLAEILPFPLRKTYFTNSGSEAVEGAMKLAKRFTGRQEIFSFKNAYHGSTQGALSLMGNESMKLSFRPLIPGIRHFPLNDPEIIDSVNENTAAVFIELIQGEAGVVESEKEFVRNLASACKKQGALLVVDEIQTGLGRTGAMFAFEEYGIVPDILLLAKSLGAGLPLGAFISSEEIMSTLSFDPVLGHITTYGGSPLSCAAGLAYIEILEKEKILENVKVRSPQLLKGLSDMDFLAIRGKGLLLALESNSSEENMNRINFCLENNLLTDWFLFNDKSMRIAPPLNITEEETEMAIRIIKNSFRN